MRIARQSADGMRALSGCAFPMQTSSGCAGRAAPASTRCCSLRPRSQRPENIWHAPDAVLIRHKNMIALPDEPVGLVEVRDMAVNPAGAPVAVVTQQCEIAGALFGHQDVAVGQYELGASD